MNRDEIIFRLEKSQFDLDKIGVDKSLFLEQCRNLGLDLISLKKEYQKKINKHKKIKVNDLAFDPLFAFFNKILPLEESSLLYEKILSERTTICSFLTKFKNGDQLEDFEIFMFNEKIKAYGMIVDLYCKGELRSRSSSIQFDNQLNDFVIKNKKEIDWVNKNFSLDYADLTDSYFFWNEEFSYQIKSIPLFFALKDLLGANDDKIFPYYLAVFNNKKDSKRIRELWAFSIFIKDLKSKTLIK